MLKPKPKPQTTRSFTKTTFTKAIAVRPFYNIHGIDTSKKWAKQRIYNEAAVLNFIREHTTIPVPRVLETGESESGTYLTVERLNGIQLDWVGNRCLKLPSSIYSPEDHRDVKCTACQNIANSIAEDFIQRTVIPQLACLKSKTTGFNGVVIPSPWVTEYDRRPDWAPKVGEHPDFVFVHGDLGPQNILFDPQTIKVSGVVDWENAGYYPEEFLDLWAVVPQKYYDIYRDESRLDKFIAMLQ